MMCYARFVMLRGRCSCAISSRPTPSPTHESPLSPLFPLLPGNSPVTPLFPLLTQKQGGGACFLISCGRLRAVDCEPSLSPNFFVFSPHRYYLLNYMYNNIVGAPTYCKWFATGASTLKSGPSLSCGCQAEGRLNTN